MNFTIHYTTYILFVKTNQLRVLNCCSISDVSVFFDVFLCMFYCFSLIVTVVELLSANKLGYLLKDEHVPKLIIKGLALRPRQLNPLIDSVHLYCAHNFYFAPFF